MMDHTNESRKQLERRLARVEAQLEKVRGASPLTHGWQTRKLARAQRSWDQLAAEKRWLMEKLDEL